MSSNDRTRDVKLPPPSRVLRREYTHTVQFVSREYLPDPWTEAMPIMEDGYASDKCSLLILVISSLQPDPSAALAQAGGRYSRPHQASNRTTGVNKDAAAEPLIIRRFS